MGLLIDDWYTPPKASEEYITLTFDKTEKLPDVPLDGQNVVGATHIPFDDPYIDRCKRRLLKLFDQGIGNHTQLREQYPMFLSEDLKDYLRLYRNSRQVDSDRMHACVPALVYRNSAKLYLENDRAELFDWVLEGDIFDGATIDNKLLRGQKDALIKEMNKLKEDKMGADKIRPIHRR